MDFASFTMSLYNKEMKALQYFGPHDLRFVELPTPTPKSGEVLLKIGKVGICGTDLHIYTGGMHVPTPTILGHEFVATIAEVGEGVSSLTAGQRVVAEHVIGCQRCLYCKMGKRNLCIAPIVLGIHKPGALAEYMVVPAELVSVLPDTLSEDEGVLAEPLSIAVYAASKARLTKGEKVAVIGQGPIGLLVDFVTKASGASVYGIDRHDTRLSYATEHEYIVKGYNVKNPAFLSEFHTETGDGADLVFEAVGSDSSADLALTLAKPGGRVIILGVFEHDVKINMMAIVRKELEVFGSWTNIFSLDETLQLLATEQFDTKQFITHRYPFVKAQEAFEEALTDKSERIKTIIEFS